MHRIRSRRNCIRQSQVNTSEYAEAFAKTRDAIEELMVQNLVRGERFSGPNGIYFTGLQLTRKGEQTAIQERRRVAELKKEFP